MGGSLSDTPFLIVDGQLSKIIRNQIYKLEDSAILNTTAY